MPITAHGRVSLTRGLAGEWVSRDGRWLITPVRTDRRVAGTPRMWRVRDTFKQVFPPSRGHTATVLSLPAARALINYHLGQAAS